MPIRDVSHEHITAVAAAITSSEFVQISLPDGYTAFVSPQQLCIEAPAHSEEAIMDLESIRISYNSVSRSPCKCYNRSFDVDILSDGDPFYFICSKLQQ